MLLLPCSGHNMALRGPLPPERFESEMSPSLFLPRGLLALVCVTIAVPAITQAQQLPTVLDCTGPFARDSDERKLAQVFGAANVERTDIPVGEGNTEPGTAIFAKDPAKRIDILWHDAYARPNVVIIRNGSTWPVAVTGMDKPVANGATLVEIEAMNGKPFTLTGFGWDLGGYTNSWDGGRLDKPVGGCNLSVRFDHAGDAPGDALDKVNGDVEFYSTDSAMRQVKPVVIEIELGWPQ
jgi:hypothetical protein